MVASGNDIHYPIWLIELFEPYYAVAYKSAEAAALDIEFWNEAPPGVARNPLDETKHVVLDNLGRRLRVRMKFGEMLEIALCNAAPMPEDLGLFAKKNVVTDWVSASRKRENCPSGAPPGRRRGLWSVLCSWLFRR